MFRPPKARAVFRPESTRRQLNRSRRHRRRVNGRIWELHLRFLPLHPDLHLPVVKSLLSQSRKPARRRQLRAMRSTLTVVKRRLSPNRRPRHRISRPPSPNIQASPCVNGEPIPNRGRQSHVLGNTCSPRRSRFKWARSTRFPLPLIQWRIWAASAKIGRTGSTSCEMLARLRLIVFKRLPHLQDRKTTNWRKLKTNYWRRG